MVAATAAPLQARVTTKVSGRQLRTRTGWTYFTGTKVRTRQRGDHGERRELRQRRHQQVQHHHIPDGGKSDEIPVMGLAFGVREVEQRHEQHQRRAREARSVREQTGALGDEGRDRDIS